MANKKLSQVFIDAPKVADDLTDNDIFYLSTGGADGAIVLTELRNKLRRSESEAFSATITADKNKNLGTYDLSGGDLTLNMAASGNIPGTEVLFKIIGDGTHVVNLGTGFDTDAIMGITDGEAPAAGTYLVRLRYETGGAILELPTKQAADIVANNAKVSYDASAQAEMAANNAKVSYDASAQAEMAANNAKVSYDASAQAEMAANNAKVSYDASAQAEMAANNAKVSYDALAQAEMAANNAKVSYDASAQAEMAANNAKVSLDDGSVTNAKLATEVENRFQAVEIDGNQTLIPAGTLDLGGKVIASMTLTENTTITALSNVPVPGFTVRVIPAGLTFNFVGKSDFVANSDGEYEVKVINYGTTASPIIRVHDGVGSATTSPSGLGDFSPTNITLDENGYFNPYTATGDVSLTYPSSGHVEDKKKYGRIVMDGVYALSVVPIAGQTISVTGFTNGAAPSAGTYILTSKYIAGVITVELKAIADIESIVIVTDDFTGATIDTTTNWDLVNPSSAIIEFEQVSDRLQTTIKTTATTSSNVDHLTTKQSVTGKCTVAIDYVSTTDATKYNCKLMIYHDANNYAAVFPRNDSNNGIVQVFQSGGNARYVDTGVTFWGKRWKIEKTASNVYKFYYYNEGWVEVQASATEYDLGSVAKGRIMAWVQNSGATGNMIFDRFRFTTDNYANELP